MKLHFLFALCLAGLYCCSTIHAGESRQLQRPQGHVNYFLSLETNDWNGSMIEELRQFISQKIPIICSTALLYTLIHHDYQDADKPAGIIPDYSKNLPIENRRNSKILDDVALVKLESWSVFVNPTDDIAILLPQKYSKGMLAEFGISEMVKLVPHRNIIILFGHSLYHHKPVLLEHFKQIFNDSPLEKRLYIVGHGMVNEAISSIEIGQLQHFFNILADNHTTWAYLSSCYSGGTNLLATQKALGQLLEKRKIGFAIVIAATGETPTAGLLYIRPRIFFRNLDLFMADPQWLFGRSKNISLAKVIQSLWYYHPTANLPSIRLPGTTSFFDPIEFDWMAIITWFGLQKLRLQQVMPTGNLREVFQKLSDLEERLAQKIKPEKLRIYADNEQYMNEIEKLNTEIQQIKEKIQAHKPPHADITIDFPITTFKLLIYPVDLTDISISREGTVPTIISKIPSQSMHFIKQLSVITLQDSVKGTLTEEVVGKKCGFTELLGRTKKAWFIEDFKIKDKKGHTEHIRGLCIAINYKGLTVDDFDNLTYMMHFKRDGSYYELTKPAGKTVIEQAIDQQLYEKMVKDVFEIFRADKNALFEASRGHESPATEQEAFDKFISHVTSKNG